MTSRTPAVIDALITALSTTTTVYDGVPPGAVWPPEFAVVGGYEDESGEGATSPAAWNGLGAHHQQETGQVSGVIVVQGGSASIKTKRDRAYAILGTLQSAIVADPTLGGAVSSGWLLVSEQSYEPRSNDRGAYVRIPFTTSFQSRI